MNSPKDYILGSISKDISTETEVKTITGAGKILLEVRTNIYSPDFIRQQSVFFVIETGTRKKITYEQLKNLVGQEGKIQDGKFVYDSEE